MSTSNTVEIGPLKRAQGLRPMVTGSLMSAIFTRKVVAGDRLIVMKLAKQLGVSASPVREALVELAAVGLVNLLPNRGAVCLPFGPCELREVFHVRRLLEAEATRLACGHVAHAELEDLQRESQTLLESKRSTSAWRERAMEVDMALHDLVLRSCGNGRLRLEVKRYEEMMRCIRQVAGNRRDIQAQAIEDHLALIDALLDEQPEAAAGRMAEHISATAERLIPLLFPDADEEQT